MDRLKRPSTLGASALVVSALWPLLTNWGPISGGHPSYLVFYIAVLGIGIAVLIAGLRAGGRPKRFWLSVVAAAGLLALGVAALWLSPFGAEETAIVVSSAPDGLVVEVAATHIVLDPEGVAPAVGVVFRAGARVDARAYVEILAPLARSGHRVVIVKEPLGIAFLAPRFAASWIEEHPEVESWVIAGHSLGGVVAASEAAASDAAGLLLWASFPASDISDSSPEHVASVYGTNDRLTEPARVEASASDLPASTRFRPIRGAVHSHFGHYGLQPGDGEPDVDRETAQNQIVSASLELLAALEP